MGNLAKKISLAPVVLPPPPVGYEKLLRQRRVRGRVWAMLVLATLYLFLRVLGGEAAAQYTRGYEEARRYNPPTYTQPQQNYYGGSVGGYNQQPQVIIIPRQEYYPQQNWGSTWNGGYGQNLYQPQYQQPYYGQPQYRQQPSYAPPQRQAPQGVQRAPEGIGGTGLTTQEEVKAYCTTFRRNHRWRPIGATVVVEAPLACLQNGEVVAYIATNGQWYD